MKNKGAVFDEKCMKIACVMSKMKELFLMKTHEKHIKQHQEGS